MQIFELSQIPDRVDPAVDYFWKKWGSPTNVMFYKDCILHSLDPKNALPKFYLALDGDNIAGSYALLVNDINSRQDLMPWFACLFVEPDYRGQALGFMLQNHGITEAREKGFGQLYLSTDLENYYEKNGWTYYAKTFGVTGGEIKVYRRPTEVL